MCGVSRDALLTLRERHIEQEVGNASAHLSTQESPQYSMLLRSNPLVTYIAPKQEALFRVAEEG